MKKAVNVEKSFCDVSDCENETYYRKCFFCQQDYCDTHKNLLESYYYEYLNGAQREVCRNCQIKERDNPILALFKQITNLMARREQQTKQFSEDGAKLTLELRKLLP